MLAVGTVLDGVGGARAEAAEPELTNTLGLNDPIEGTDVGELGGGQYRNNNQRNFWWNAQQSRWDGILPTASPPAADRSQWWLWHDLGGTPTPVTEVENATARTPDAYWDEEDRMLYVFLSRGNSGTSRFRRFRYDPDADEYVEHSRAGGVNAPEMLRGGSRVTITKSPNGHLWAGVNYDNNLLISRSTDGGDTWPEPVAIKSTAIAGEGHWVVFTTGGSTRVGFAATEDGLAPGGQARVHFIHLDHDESDWTNPARWTDETSDLPDWEGDERADDELSAVVFENRVFIVIETEPLGDARRADRPQLIVYERPTNGEWHTHIIRRYTSGSEDAKRPVITVDAAARLLVVTAGTTQRSHADLWYAPIDALADHDEQWSTLRVFEVNDAATENIYNTRLALPRFPVAADADLLLLIDDQGDAKRMWRQLVRSSGQPSAPPVESEACPAGQVPASPFTDVAANNTHRPNIDCVVWYGLAHGRTATAYEPAAGVRRDQMASFVARLIDEAGADLPSPADQGFVDIAGNEHADRINQLAAIEVIQGATDQTYDPRQIVRRDQMASFLVGAFEYIDGQALPAAPGRFPDTAGNVHEANIDKVAEAGFASGRADGTFGPGANMRRDQMATFLAHVLQRLVQDERLTPPS